MTYPSGKVVAYGYDSQGRITAMTVDGAPLLSNIHYQPFGPATGWTFGNGNNYSRPLDSDGRIASYTLSSTINSLSYDPASRITTAGNQAFSYDTLNRLTGYTGTVSQTFSYDATGNRTLFTQDANSDSYTIDSTNNHISINGLHNRSYTYTPSGNISADSLHGYNYDPRNRLSAVDFSTYSINGLGQRIKKTVPRPAPGGATTQISTLFVYDEQGQLIGEYKGNAATLTETVYLGSQPVAALKPSATYYIHSDHLNTPRAITNSANIIIWRWNSDAFGSTTANEDPDANGARFNYNLRFPGQYFDQESGLHYNYFRDYDPVTGRYVQSDPIGLDGGINTYAYVGGNPISFIDPYGLFQFGQRKLDGFPFEGGQTDNGLGFYHEHGFYQDGTGDNVGFFKDKGDGHVGPDSGYPVNKDEYTRYPEQYDDARMRRAQANVKSGKYNLGSNNCQDYADKLRDEYNRLLQEDFLRDYGPLPPYSSVHGLGF